TILVSDWSSDVCSSDLSQLFSKPYQRFDLQEFARRTPGMSAAKLKALVDRAATSAATQGRKIEATDLRQALSEMGGKDRPLIQRSEERRVGARERPRWT